MSRHRTRSHRSHSSKPETESTKQNEQEKQKPQKRESLQYALIQKALDKMQNNHSTTAYKRKLKDFATWAKSEGVFTIDGVNRELIQRYEWYLEEHPKGYSANTIHTYLAPVCKAVGVNMSEIRKPKRSAGTITRSRDGKANQQGTAQEKEKRYQRIVAFQKVVGIRRNELTHLKGSDLVTDDYGALCVHVERGKGGKEQLQVVLPEDEELVRQTFAGIDAKNPVFQPYEIASNIDFHAMRAAHARNCYDYYCKKIEADPSYQEKLKKELLEKWDKGHERLKEENSDKFKRQIARFLRDMRDDPYKLRGENQIRAIKEGKPHEYNRVALMAVSINHLSHWRLNVTVSNYML